MKKLLFNPFEKFDARALLFTGILITVIGSLLGYRYNARFDGVLDVHFSADVKYVEPFSDNVFNIAFLFIALYIFGRIINKKVRPIDILATVMISRLPLYLVCFANVDGKLFIEAAKAFENGPNALSANPADLMVVAIIGLLMVPFLVWYIALLYNGFKIAVNAKTAKHNLLFALALIIAEILSKILLYIIY
ncbi:hypothetical protein ACX0HA_16790 [Flavobacterium hauense]